MFTKGTRVRCVNGEFDSDAKSVFMNLPEAGSVYTVRSTYVGRPRVHSLPEDEDLSEIGVLLEEVRNPSDPFQKSGAEPGFNAERFVEVAS